MIFSGTFLNHAVLLSGFDIVALFTVSSCRMSAICEDICLGTRRYTNDAIPSCHHAALKGTQRGVGSLSSGKSCSGRWVRRLVLKCISRFWKQHGGLCFSAVCQIHLRKKERPPTQFHRRAPTPWSAPSAPPPWSRWLRSARAPPRCGQPIDRNIAPELIVWRH